MAFRMSRLRSLMPSLYIAHYAWSRGLHTVPPPSSVRWRDVYEGTQEQGGGASVVAGQGHPSTQQSEREARGCRPCGKHPRRSQESLDAVGDLEIQGRNRQN